MIDQVFDEMIDINSEIVVLLEIKLFKMYSHTFEKSN